MAKFEDNTRRFLSDLTRRILRVFLILAMCSTLAAAGAAAQSSLSHAPSGSSPNTVAGIARGWQLLAQGRVAEAVKATDAELARNPRSAAALSLAVEAAIAHTGAAGALQRYERALGQRQVEDALILRRIAEALLRESADAGGASALAAQGALAASGDAAATAALSAPGAGAGREARLRALASTGDDRAVRELVKALDAPGARPAAILEALGKSGSNEARDAVARQLTNPAPEVRGAAVEALGRLADPQSTAQLAPLLNDQSSYVRIRAAAALYQLGDARGLGLLQELAASDSEAGRLIAAEAMASQPDAAWLDLVRGLASADEPQIRIDAARLLAGHDPELAGQVLREALGDPNPAIREMASRTQAFTATSLGELRALMKSNDALTRVSAARRVLELTE
jgi:hypothetical protein